MIKDKTKLKVHRKKSLLFLIVFTLLFILIFSLSVVFTVFSDPNITLPQDAKFLNIISVDWFSGEISDNHEMNIPFSIFIQLLTTVAGVFLGVRIDQWFQEKENEENAHDFWSNVYTYLKKLKKGIENNENIYMLSEYKIHWDIIQKSDVVSTKQLLSNDKYEDISFAFSFLSFYHNDWYAYKSIDEWKKNTTTTMSESIQSWIDGVTKLVVDSPK